MVVSSWTARYKAISLATLLLVCDASAFSTPVRPALLRNAVPLARAAPPLRMCAPDEPRGPTFAAGMDGSESEEEPRRDFEGLTDEQDEKTLRVLEQQGLREDEIPQALDTLSQGRRRRWEEAKDMRAAIRKDKGFFDSSRDKRTGTTSSSGATTGSFRRMNDGPRKPRLSEI